MCTIHVRLRLRQQRTCGGPLRARTISRFRRYIGGCPAYPVPRVSRPAYPVVGVPRVSLPRVSRVSRRVSRVSRALSCHPTLRPSKQRVPVERSAIEMTKLTYNLHRIFAGLLLLVLVFAGADYYLDLGFFGRGAKGILILGMALVVIYGAFFSPTRQDMREHRNARKVTKE